MTFTARNAKSIELMWTRYWPDSANDTKSIFAIYLRSYLLVSVSCKEEKQDENLSVAAIEQVSNILEF
jgi:hypothetical protein